MDFADRLKIFALGFTIGMVLLFFILSKREADHVELTFPDTPEEIQREAVPGILQAYEERRVPMDSKFIAEQRRKALPEKRFQRTLLLRGKDPGQELIVVETLRQKQGIELAERVIVWSPDRLVIRLLPGSTPAQLFDRLSPAGYRLLDEGESSGTVIVGLPEVSLEAFAAAQLQLAAQADLVASVETVVLGEVNIPQD